MTENDCLFCRIAAGDVPATIVHEGEDVVAFRDIDPQAPTHVLVIPRRHVASVTALGEDDGPLLGALFAAANRIARDAGISDGGFRLVLNAGRDGGQTVHHVHMHVLGGRAMTWPPG